MPSAQSIYGAYDALRSHQLDAHKRKKTTDLQGAYQARREADRAEDVMKGLRPLMDDEFTSEFGAVAEPERGAA